ncbi:MAG: hypothetical protein IJ733_08590 [Lachnospiraceae bacterium]|nr:hypothetical protein [Lachnospiraceae bacterium]
MGSEFDWSYLWEHHSEILLLIGFTYFLFTRVLGITPLTRNRKELLDALLSFLHQEIGKPGGLYRISESLNAEFPKNPKDPVILRKMAQEILAHCGVQESEVTVKMGFEDLNSAGIYTGNEISINNGLGMRKSEILAVLIHESMHYFLIRVRGIRLEDTRENEYLTDIAALYMGFGAYIHRGYVKVGYLKRNEIRYVKKRLKEYS